MLREMKSDAIEFMSFIFSLQPSITLFPSLFSPPDALDFAFKRLDTDISLEAQVPLSSDLMKSTAIQVIM